MEHRLTSADFGTVWSALADLLLVRDLLRECPRTAAISTHLWTIEASITEHMCEVRRRARLAEAAGAILRHEQA
jgi:hypothetical protein